ncbi:pyridoxal phosphate-dependent transferase [Cladochytrium replicatum]|nr:pyridoxal phosphate-dependent transferase [Cladochytrium replicatum]
MNPLETSTVASRTKNPIRDIVDNLKVVPNPAKKFIPLSLGDPSVFGNFQPHKSTMDALVNAVQSGKANGYPPSTGHEIAREAVAQFYSRPDAPLTSKDVILASGCSDALNICIGAIGNEGQNILLPKPGFSLYETLCSSKGVECRFYNLLPHKSWEADISHMESLIDSKTAAILVNNPSNPCGSVYTEAHLRDILVVAERHNLPIISDEIYADMVFSGHKFTPLGRFGFAKIVSIPDFRFFQASLTKTVPILTTGGIAKRYLIPGWRVGWILIHDRNELFAKVRQGLNSLTQLILGPNSVVQIALPDILRAPKSFYEETLRQLEENATLCCDELGKIPGLEPVEAQGAMYIMAKVQLDKFKDFRNDLDFVEKLVQEESVLCLPGQCFRCEGAFFRVVITAPREMLKEAFERMDAFCRRHLK